MAIPTKELITSDDALHEAALDLYLAAKGWLAAEDTDGKRYTFAEIRALQALQAAVEKAERKS